MMRGKCEERLNDIEKRLSELEDKAALAFIRFDEIAEKLKSLEERIRKIEELQEESEAFHMILKDIVKSFLKEWAENPRVDPIRLLLGVVMEKISTLPISEEARQRLMGKLWAVTSLYMKGGPEAVMRFIATQVAGDDSEASEEEAKEE